MVKNYVVKKDVYIYIYIYIYIYNAKIKNIEDKIPDITNAVINTTLDAKMRLKTKYLVLLIRYYCCT